LGSVGAGGKGFTDAISGAGGGPRLAVSKIKFAAQQASLYRANQVFFLAKLGHHRFDAKIESVDQR